MSTVALPVVFCLALSATSAFAQVPFPGAVHVKGGWVPCDHVIAISVGQGCGTTPTPPPTPQAAPGLVDCTTINPYDDPDHALACHLEQMPTHVPQWLPTFRVGQRYFGAYEDFQMVVLSIARTLDGIEVVTFQWTAPNTRAAVGDVHACRNDGKGSFNSCGTWIPR